MPILIFVVFAVLLALWIQKQKRAAAQAASRAGIPDKLKPAPVGPRPRPKLASP